MLLSIIICTHNRADLLKEAIQSVLPQLSGADAELLIIDNASSDTTHAVCLEFSEHHPGLRYYFEPQQGLSYARNRGCREAQGEYLGYLDDDALAGPDWIQKAREIITQDAPDVFGGPFFAYYRCLKPAWYRDEYGSHQLTAQARALSSSEYPDGGNFFIRKTTLEDLGGFNLELGMNGSKVAYGEETELVERLRHKKADCLVYYDPQLAIRHLVPARKMHIRWIIGSNLKHGYASYFLVPIPVSRSKPVILSRLLNRIFVFLADSLIRAPLRKRKTYPYIQNYWYERSTNYLYEIGKLAAEFQHSLKGS